MAERKVSYESKSDVDSIEELSKKLTADLRKHIRALGPYPVLTDKWNAMATSLGRIASISEMERNLPKDKAEATLWECEELALRYLLEDGKLNLCLRLLEEYRVVQKEVLSGARTLTEERAEYMSKFEQGIGVLLKNAWMHSEALQTTDLPLLISHIADILAEAAEREYETSQEGAQPAVVLHYVLAIATHLESIDESRIMPLLLDGHVFKNAALHVAKNFKQLPEGDYQAAAFALAKLADSEEFGTHPDRYVEDDDCRAALVQWKSLFISEMRREMEVRRAIRPLLDLIDRSELRMMK